MFAERGYESTTNRLLAAAADLTAGAVYHHYGSKLAVYVAVHDARRQVSTRFSGAIAALPTFLGQVEALLDEAHAMNVEDPSLARFLGTFRVDVQRHPHIGEAIKAREQVTSGMVEGIVDLGINTGELSRDDRQAVIAMLRAFLVGLTDAMSTDRRAAPARHQRHEEVLEGPAHDAQTSSASMPR